MTQGMTRREFLRRSAPMVAAGLVTPWFVEAVMRRLFPPKKYWDMGAGGVRYVDIHVCPPHAVEYIEGVRNRYAEKRINPDFFGTITIGGKGSDAYSDDQA